MTQSYRENPGPIDQAITDCRLTLKKPYLAFLGNPDCVELSYGPGGMILIHNPEQRAEFVQKVLPPQGTPLTGAEELLERRLNSGAMRVPVDDHGRIRIEQVYLAWAGLEPRCQAYLMPRPHYGWIELCSRETYYQALSKPDPDWEAAMDSIRRRLSRESEAEGEM